MPTEARGNYLPEPLTYARQRPITVSQSATRVSRSRVDTTCWQLFRPAINTAHFYLFVAEVMSNYLTTDELKNFSLLPDAPFGLRPVAFATSATWLIRHCTHPFNGPLSRTTRVSRYQKGKTNLDFTEARDSEWQWHQLGHMQVCTSLQTDNHASTPPLCFLQAGCPSCHPTNSVKALKAQGRDKQLGDKQGSDLQNILRQSGNDKVTINLRRTSNLQNILQ